MLEIRYKMDTGKITASAYSPKFVGGHLEPKEGEGIAVLDLLALDTLEAWLYDGATQTLIPNPDYVKPEPPRDLFTEIDDLKVRMEKLEKK